jgi:hypothetical protein
MVDLSLVPDACTLPSVDRPVRLAEWDALFADVVGVERVDARHAQLAFAAGPGLEHRVRDLSRRETGCCSFFEFTVESGADADGRPTLVLRVGVPSSRADVLDAWVRWADDVRRGRRVVRT